MKRIFSIILPLLCIAGSIEAQELAYFVDALQFRKVEKTVSNLTPYVEVHTHINGNSVVWVQNDAGGFMASVEAIYALQEGVEEDAGVLKVIIKSPILADTGNGAKNIILTDIRKMPVSEIKYTLIGVLRDLNNEAEKSYTFEKDIWIEANNHFSDIIFTDVFAKSVKNNTFTRYGWDVRPRISNNFFENIDTLSFYMELYNLGEAVQKSAPDDKIEHYFITSYITQANSTDKMAKYQKRVRMKARNFDIFHTEFDISGLPSQTYFLNFEVYSPQNKLITSHSEKIFLFNDRVEEDVAETKGDYDRVFGFPEPEIDYYLGPMGFISNTSEQNFKKALKTYTEKKNFFFSFWDKRKKNASDNPLKPFREFKASLDYVNEHYKSSYLDGWKTARGRVLLQNGPPNDIQYFQGEKWRYPYEIWSYNRLKTQNNVKFVFYDPDLITGDYPLLHSTKFGELQNPKWQLELVKRNTQNNNIGQDDLDNFEY